LDPHYYIISIFGKLFYSPDSMCIHWNGYSR